MRSMLKKLSKIFCPVLFAVSRHMLVLRKKACQRGRMKIGAQKYSIGLVYGLGAIFVLLAISSLVISLILRFSDMTEHALHMAVTMISFFSLFLGGLVGGGKGKKKGWLLGSLTGVLYTAIVFLVQYLGYNELFTVKQAIYHACYIVAAAMGGILGVNLFSGRSRET